MHNFPSFSFFSFFCAQIIRSLKGWRPNDDENGSHGFKSSVSRLHLDLRLGLRLKLKQNSGSSIGLCRRFFVPRMLGRNPYNYAAHKIIRLSVQTYAYTHLSSFGENRQSSTDVIPPPLTRRSVQNAGLPFFALAPSFPGIRFSPLCASLSVRVNHSSYSCFHRGDRIYYFIKSTGRTPY